MSLSPAHDGIKRMDDYLSRIVAAVIPLTTRGGSEFPAGCIGKVDGHHRGRLTVSFGRYGLIRSLDRTSVALLPEGTERRPGEIAEEWVNR